VHFKLCGHPQSKEDAWTFISKAGAPWSPGGSGLAIATNLAREGAHVIVTGRTGRDGVVGFAGDLGTAAAAEEVVRRYRDIEILVNNLTRFCGAMGMPVMAS
jgi:NAD(P)-dependent dehydrogenase (short-subunit alcohol dehydrogenase family)